MTSVLSNKISHAPRYYNFSDLYVPSKVLKKSAKVKRKHIIPIIFSGRARNEDSNPKSFVLVFIHYSTAKLIHYSFCLI